MDIGLAILEFYVSLVAYTILHMIFVISSDFVEAFNIPPLNIGIYVDKLAAIRALLMVIADILEWGITQKWLHDPGAYTKLFDKSARRIGSVFSFFLMWICRCHYIWILYFSDNKSLIAFINLCLEGFWFGVFQMSFFAIGPEYNAFTSLAIHTMGNFIFFLQLILNRLAKKYPSINCLSRVRVHAWVCLVTSTISLGPWVYFCLDYLKGNTDQYQSLVCVLKETVQVESTNIDKPEELAKALATKMRDATVSELQTKLQSNPSSPEGKELEKKFTEGTSVMNAKKISEKLGGSDGNENVAKLLVKEEFGHTPNGTLTDALEGTNNTVEVKIGNSGTESKGTANVTVTGGSNEFNALVEKLAVEVPKQVSGSNLTADQLKIALNQVTNEILALVKEEDFTNVSGATSVNVTAETSKNKVIVTINEQGGTGTHKGEATVTVGSNNITIEVTGSNVKGLDNNDKAKAIAMAIVMALVDKRVADAAQEKGVKIALKDSATTVITINVKDSGSDITGAVGRRIARRLAKILTQVDSVTLKGASIKFKISASINEKIEQKHVWSPFLLFIIGAFAEDFAVPGVLPFAFLDPEKANLVNYLTPLFFFTGAFIILLLNDVFSGEQSVLMEGWKGIKDYDSRFKEWSEGEANGWHSLWMLNLLKYTAFFIAMWSIHGTFADLRCIIQSRWRVLLLTMFVVVPRATLEVAGYVGVANFAIAQGETMNFDGFSYIAYHDMLAMFCRFVYGKFAVGYNWTIE